MSSRKIAAVAVCGALFAGGAGVAVAAVTKSDREQAIIDDAAKRLDVTPEKLSEALSAARDAQTDKAVKDGRLTQEQADAIKERRKQSGRVLGGPGAGGHHGPGRHRGHGVRRAIGADLAKALGISQTRLRELLQDGKSVADIAKAEGKSLTSVKSPLKTAIKTRADKAVKDGDITQAQADRMLEHFDEAFDRLGERRGRHRGGPPHPRPADPDAKPGAFRPDPADPADVQPAGDAVTS
ncbi:MAG: hypothetical protein WKF48_03050 [Solirubrobacteraceae bacterium]